MAYATEGDAYHAAHMVELQVGHFFPDAARLITCRDWGAVVCNGDALVALMQAHICDPIVASALPKPCTAAAVAAGGAVALASPRAKAPAPTISIDREDSAALSGVSLWLSRLPSSTSLCSSVPVDTPPSPRVRGSGNSIGLLGLSSLAYPARLSTGPLYIAAKTASVVAVAAVATTAAVFAMNSRARVA